VINQESSLVDGETFTLLSTLIQTSAMQGDEEGAKVLGQLQSELLHETEFGRKLLADSEETQKALKELEKANKEGLTREKLLEILSSVKSESSLTTLVSLTRSGLDYQFFQILSERIEREEGESKQNLVDLRAKLLDLTRKIDTEVKKRLEKAASLLDKIIAEENAEQAIEKYAAEIDEYFTEAVQIEFDKAHENNDLARIEKIQKVVSVLEKLSAPPPEVELIQKLLEAHDETERKQLFDKNAEKIDDQFLQTITAILAEGESRQQSPELIDSLQTIYKMALRKSMEKNLRG